MTSHSLPYGTAAQPSGLVRGLGRAFGGGLIICALAVTVFTLTSHGIGLRSDDDVLPAEAPTYLIGMLAGLACAAPILPFTSGLRTQRFTVIFPGTVLIGLLAAVTAVICAAASSQLGSVGTVWAALDASALAVLTIAAVVSAAAALGFAITVPTAADHRSTLASLGLLALFVAAVAGMLGLGTLLETTPTGPAALLSVLGCALTALLLFASRRRADSHRHDAPAPCHQSSGGTTPRPTSDRSGQSPRRGGPRRTAALPIHATALTGLFPPGEIEFARLSSLPPFDTDFLILTDLRIMRVRTDADGAVAQLSQATPWQVAAVRAEEFRGRATVTVELHVGSSMRLEETTPAEAQRFVDTLNGVAAHSRA
ncbi:hypothetical protein [Brevibacterium sp. JSBI002]|uniref:hypothetical protein n=1 Tax=Brevibacterium sp. JSBI002 TaxID=2886045 RepID=UPI00222EC708|nr:hypothetical protein [Brevibacterium sp. JSBI002]UZD62548.1 hypothetical protein LJ362_01380 [Brevibacterium sp. JSBI002]